MDALARLQEGDLPLTPQAVDGATYAAKIAKAEARIDWRHPAKDVHNRIRGLSPFPGAWCEGSFGAGLERLKVLRSTLAEGEGEPGDLLVGSRLFALERSQVGQTVGGKNHDGN